MKNIFFPFLQDEANPAGGAGGGGTPPPNTPDPAAELTKERDRLSLENAELRKKQKGTEDKLVSLGEEIANMKKSGAKGSGDLQKLTELQATELEGLKAANTALKEGFKNTILSGKIREEALKQGVKTDMVDLLDNMSFDEVEFSLDDQAMKFNVKGVDSAIANLKKLRPSFFDVKNPPKFNHGNGGGNGGGGGGDVTDLETAKGNYLAALKNRVKDPAGFNKAHLDYQKALTAAKAAKK